MNSLLLSLLCLNLMGYIVADENKCRVDTYTESSNVAVYCYYLEIDHKDIPLETNKVPPSDYLSLHLINCNGSINENSFQNLKDVSSISITSGSMDEFVLPDLSKLNYIQMENFATPILKGALKNVQDSLTGIKFSNNQFLINDDDLEGLNNLESLEISKQNVTSLKWMKDLKKLEKLRIFDSNIEILPKDTFENNPDLTDIQISSVPIKVIENGAFDPLTNLTMLLLTGTDLTTFDWHLTKNLKKLEGLGIPARSVKSLDVKKLFENSPNLHAFYFMQGDMQCLEIKYLLDEMKKYQPFPAVAYSGGDGKYFKTC